jgi:hypothetical protein
MERLIHPDRRSGDSPNAKSGLPRLKPYQYQDWQRFTCHLLGLWKSRHMLQTGSLAMRNKSQEEFMSPVSDELLCQRYPLIFADRNRPMEDCCMGQGFECDDGWFDILDVLCERIQFLTDHDGAPQVVAQQGKFG